MCVCVCVCVCVHGCLSVCQAGDGVRNSSTDLGIKLMCWDQGPAPRKLSLWLRAVMGTGSGRALASAMARESNTCPSPAPGPVNTEISLHPATPLVVIIVINNGRR